MTLCRKCGKEIQDGEELCEDCKNAETNSGENYLDELMQNIDTDDMGEPAASERILAMQKEREEREEAEGKDDPDIVIEPGVPFPVPDLEPEPELDEEPMPEPDEEPVTIPELDEEPMPEPDTSEDAAELPEAEAQEEPPEDINELLNLLSKDYEDEDEDSESEDYEFEDDAVFDDLNDTPNQSMSSAVEASLFSEDDSGSIFADGSDEIAVDDIFQDALSAVDYSEKENDEEDVMSLDAFDVAEEGQEEPVQEAEVPEVESVPVTEPSKITPKKIKKPKKEGKVSFWKRIFGNVVTEQTAAEEEQEREQEKAAEEAKAAEKEEKKKQAEQTKEEKATEKAAEKERKAAEKAEKATAKAAEKEEKKRLKLEREANEVVGKINPVGAAIVMVFFGLICISVILGTQMLSYSSALKNAESTFASGDYRSAYESIAGVDVSESSQEMADKVRICMQMQKELDSYTNYYKMKMYLEALDSLMKGIRNYDVNRQKADDYGIINEYNALESKVADALNSEFGVSETQARSINGIEDLAEYTSRLEDIIQRWEAKNREDER